MTKFAYTDGQKAATLSDLDEFMDWLVSENAGDGEISASLAARKVAFVYRGVRMIADAVRAAPWQIVNQRTQAPVDTSSEYTNALGWLPNPKRLLELTTRSLLGPGSAYLFWAMRGRNREELRYLAASTITPTIDAARGLVGFTRKVNGVETAYPVERFVYFWPADEGVELGPPQSSTVQAALLSAGANYYTARFVSDFFARGAIKGTLLAVKGNPVESERKRLKEWFTRTFARGSRSQFATEVVNADALEPIKIGEGLESLNNSELTLQMREDIAVALGIPMSMLLSSTIAGMGGGGVAESDTIRFYRDTVRHQGEFIADVLNAQVFAPLSLRFEFLWDTLDVFQQDENQRAQAFKTYVDARMRPEVAAMMLGLELPEDAQIPPHYAAAFDAQPAPVLPFGFGQAPAAEDDDDDEDASEADEDADATPENLRALDLERWQRKALRRFEEGKPEKALEFESAAIPPTLKAAICGALEAAQSVEDVNRVFLWVGYP